MKYVALDTNAYSALQKGNKIVSSHIIKATEVGLPINVIGELYFGVFDGKKSSENYSILQDFLNNQRVVLLNINLETASIFGEISAELKKSGKPMQQNDIWIASLCKQNGFSLISNDRGFSNVIGLNHITF